ncbi:MAG TPA: YidC/Oxa1 family membrane protein insertase [Candidatus Avanaerovorax faecigallinarum]|nr:YidC/Oxa1 family membrane protein insertase [Candidatus Avanaerovorax faecigallinarum]
MLGLIARPFGFLLSFFYDILGNYALAIVVLSALVRVAMYPLYKKQVLSMAGMTTMQPKIREIQKKYANDRETMNIKMQELYKEEGFNPAAGCLPMIIQMIVISGLFGLLRYPLTYLGNDTEMVFAVHHSFLWMEDLSQPDLWILPILSGVATFASFWMSSQNSAMQQQAGNAMNIIMKYLFPIMIVWLARSYPAGLAIYWFISQFVQIFFNIRFNVLRKEIREGKVDATGKKINKKK